LNGTLKLLTDLSATGTSVGSIHSRCAVAHRWHTGGIQVAYRCAVAYGWHIGWNAHAYRWHMDGIPVCGGIQVTYGWRLGGI
jgi:hypothetical protein